MQNEWEHHQTCSLWAMVTVCCYWGVDIYKCVIANMTESEIIVQSWPMRKHIMWTDVCVHACVSCCWRVGVYVITDMYWKYYRAIWTHYANVPLLTICVCHVCACMCMHACVCVHVCVKGVHKVISTWTSDWTNHICVTCVMAQKGGWALLMSLPCLKSQGCHLIPSFCLLSCYSA